MLAMGRYPEFLKMRVSGARGHLSNQVTAKYLASHFNEHLKYIWLCHLSEENNHPELARKTLESVLRSYGIIAGVDFKLEVLRRKIPTGPFSLT
jgi:phosphoribosyl 1,2-cyclic phosphodiesterase